MAAPLSSKTLNPLRSFIRRFIVLQSRINHIRVQSLSSNTIGASSDDQLSNKDPFPLYSSQDVQNILRRITGFDLMKLAGPQMTKLNERPVYKLLTDDELSKELKEANDRLSKRIDNPPPYMNARRPVTEPLAVDPDLAHFDSSNYVFTDISFGVKDMERSVVIREVDGTLRVAPFDVRERMNQTYFPREGRSIIMPKMFEEEHLERMISENKFCYILERACVQFEPDAPDFIRVSHRVYSAVHSSQQFDLLRSTRHFAPLTFHLAWVKMIDSLLIDMLTRDLESDAKDLVKLYCMIHSDGACAEGLLQIDQDDTEAVVKLYIEKEARVGHEVELALQAMMDRKKTQTPQSLSS